MWVIVMGDSRDLILIINLLLFQMIYLFNILIISESQRIKSRVIGLIDKRR
jgi:hypothetical protein